MANIPSWLNTPWRNNPALENSVVVDKESTKRNQQQNQLNITAETDEKLKRIAAEKQAEKERAERNAFLDGFDDPYGEKREQERQQREEERKERFANIRANADKRNQTSQSTTDPFLDGFNGVSNQQRVKFPNTQLQSKPLAFPNTQMQTAPTVKFPNTQLQVSPYKKNDTQFSKTDPFVEGFNDPYGEKEKEEKSKWQKVLDGISTGLTAASFIPGLDTFTNIAQIPVDLLRGDFVGAGLDLVGAIPFVGEVADVAKTARTADRIIDGVRVTDKLVDGVKVIETVDDAYDAVKVADEIGDTIKAVDATTDAAKGIGNIEDVIDLPHIKYPGDDPSIAPGKDFEWRGKYPPSEGNGAWYNPKTDESMHWDLNHEDPIGPHWDYIDSNGNFFRVFKDGRIEPSKKGGKNR